MDGLSVPSVGLYLTQACNLPRSPVNSCRITEPLQPAFDLADTSTLLHIKQKPQYYHEHHVGHFPSPPTTSQQHPKHADVHQQAMRSGSSTIQQRSRRHHAPKFQLAEVLQLQATPLVKQRVQDITGAWPRVLRRLLAGGFAGVQWSKVLVLHGLQRSRTFSWVSLLSRPGVSQ